MSIFKFTGAQSPPRRLLIQPSPTSPFCTSPSQLQEVTLDPDSTTFTYMGLQKCNTAAGRSVKEFEEQLTSLRKENFNLKLRIYFLEERMGSNFNIDKENAIKKNIELSVELESLRKEIEEKQELLCQAVKAMELEEEEHKKDVAARDRDIENLKQELQNLQENANISLLTNNNVTNPGSQLTLYAAHLHLDNDKASDIFTDLHNQIKELERTVKKERNRGDHLERLLAAADCDTIKSKDLELEFRLKDSKIKSIEQELKESTYKICSLEKQVRDFETTSTTLASELETRSRELLKKEKELVVRDSQIQELKRALADTEGQMDAEQRKTEKYRCSLTKRNTLLSEKDVYIERLENKVRQLEACLKEVTSGASPSPRRKTKSHNNDADSFFSVHGSSTSAELSAGAAAATDLTPQLTQTPDNTLTPRHHQNHHQSSLPSNSPYHDQSQSPQYYSAGDHIDLNSSAAQKSPDSLKELERAKEEILRLKKDQHKAVKMIRSMINTRREHTEEIERLTSLVEQKESEIVALQSEMQQLREKKETNASKPIYQKISELNLTATLSPTANRENSISETAEDEQLCEQYKTLSVELEKQIQVLVETLKEKDAVIQTYKTECDNYLSELKEKQNRIIDLEFEMVSNMEEKSDSSPEKDNSSYKRELVEKDKEILRLEMELRKRTGDLQTLVNKELWEKNREIEKFQIRFGDLIQARDYQILQLKKDLDDKNMQLNLLKEKINELESQTIVKREELYNKFIPENENVNLDYYKNELEKSEKLKSETQNVCTILSTRLEELCQFLDSLLKQKSVLGFLGNKQKTHLRKIIDQSLDLSRTLSMSISLNPNQSLLQLTNISQLLEISDETSNFPEDHAFSILSDDVSLTYKNHLKLENHEDTANHSVVAYQAEVIKYLQGEVKELKEEIKIRDVEIENQMMSNNKDIELKNDQEFVEAVIDFQSSFSESPKSAQSPKRILQELLPPKLKNLACGNQSESESWSEPDRNVSMQRMGITDDKAKSTTSKRSRLSQMDCFSSESTTEDERTLSRTSSKRNTIVSLHEQVCELEKKLMQQEQDQIAIKDSYLEAEKALKEEREKIEAYENREKELVCKVKMTEEKLRDAEGNLAEANKKIDECNKVIKALEEFKIKMQSDIKEKDKELQHRLNELTKEKQMALKAAQEAQKMADDAKKEIAKAELKLTNLQEEIKIVEKKTRDSMEEEYKTKLKNIENEYKNSLQVVEQKNKQQLLCLESECKSQVEIIMDFIKSIKETCAEDRQRSSDVANHTSQLEFIINELEKIKLLIRETGVKVKTLEANEFLYKQQIHKLEILNDEKIKDLYLQLDTVSLQHSETMLEKSKLLNEKNQLEQDVQKYIHREQELTKQVNDFQTEFKEAKYSLQNQLRHLEEIKACLETKISYLETANADLRRRLITSDNSSFSLPNSPCKYSDLYPNKTLPIPKKNNHLYRRQLSDTSPLPDDISAKGSLNILQLQAPNVLEVENDTRYGNSSPDLGIESDQGRFSSLEANVNIPRPLLPTLELTVSMNNLLDCDISSPESLCRNEKCLLQLKGIINENSELKKRLSRTRRALQETVTQLTLANQRKKEVEKTICKQIHKTSQVLRKAKANLDSGSESELKK